MYKSLDKKSIKVMRINALISGLIVLTIVAVAAFVCWQNFEGTLAHIIIITIVVITLIACLLDIILFPNIRYKRYKYLVTDEKIEVKKGLFLITRSIILVERVQKIEISSGPIDRKYNLANVNIFTAAGLVDIKFLDNKEAEEITKQINELLKAKLEIKNEN